MDEDRRKFLKIVLIGSVAILVKKILEPPFLEHISNSFRDTKISAEKFKVVEDLKKLSIYDHSGEEIFQIDKEG